MVLNLENQPYPYPLPTMPPGSPTQGNGWQTYAGLP
jgi:hypothetical protein